MPWLVPVFFNIPKSYIILFPKAAPKAAELRVPLGFIGLWSSTLGLGVSPFLSRNAIPEVKLCLRVSFFKEILGEVCLSNHRDNRSTHLRFHVQSLQISPEAKIQRHTPHPYPENSAALVAHLNSYLTTSPEPDTIAQKVA